MYFYLISCHLQYVFLVVALCIVSYHLQHAQLANKACIVILLAVTYSMHLLFFCFVNILSAKNECFYNPVDFF